MLQQATAIFDDWPSLWVVGGELMGNYFVSGVSCCDEWIKKKMCEG